MKRNLSQLSQELREGSSEAGRQLSELRWSGPARRHPAKASDVAGLLLLGALIAVCNDAYGSTGEPPGSDAGPPMAAAQPIPPTAGGTRNETHRRYHQARADLPRGRVSGA